MQSDFQFSLQYNCIFNQFRLSLQCDLFILHCPFWATVHTCSSSFISQKFTKMANSYFAAFQNFVVLIYFDIELLQFAIFLFYFGSHSIRLNSYSAVAGQNLFFFWGGGGGGQLGRASKI